MKSSFPARLARKMNWLEEPVHVAWEGGVASFTFDDFPLTALTHGGKILERYGARGTYYTAMNFAGSHNHFGRMFQIGDMVSAHREGHEIGCHTYSHFGCRRTGRGAITAEIDRNSHEIAEVLGGTVPTSFAYPYGSVSLTARRALKARFSSCRGTAEGLNNATADLADLRVTALFGHLFDEAAVYQTIDEACARNGWVIFYTHDVTEQPSEWGCTPAQLETVAAYVAGKMDVLPVRDVVARFLNPARAG